MANLLRRLSLPRQQAVPETEEQPERLPLEEIGISAASMPPIVDRRSARMRGRSWLATLVVIALAGAVGGWMASRTMESPREVAARSRPPTATIITADVQSTKIRRTVISRGRVGAIDSVKVAYGMLLPSDESADAVSSSAEGASADSSGGGSDVLTAVFVKQGDGVRQGRAVVEVNGRPVIVLQGKRASYRDIKPGMSGVDVEQLQRSLSATGDYSGPVSGVLDGATRAAVDRMYRVAGYAPPTPDDADQAAIQTDRNTLADAISALADAKEQRRSASRVFVREVKTWKRAHKKDPAAAGPRPTFQGPSDSEISSAQRAVTAARQALDRRGTMVPRNEVVFVPQLPASVTQIGMAIGYAPGSPLFTLSPSALVLTTQIPTSQADFLKEGSRVEVDLPGDQVTGRVISVRGAVTPGQTRVRISTPGRLPISLEGTDVKVTFVAASTSGKVLAVPEGAINSDSDGDLSVIVQAADKSLTRVPVAIGVTGSDLVEVQPEVIGTLAAGDKVVVGG